MNTRLEPSNFPDPQAALDHVVALGAVGVELRDDLDVLFAGLVLAKVWNRRPSLSEVGKVCSRSPASVRSACARLARWALVGVEGDLMDFQSLAVQIRNRKSGGAL